MACARVSLFAVLVFAVATTAFADTVRVTVDRALVWNRPSGVSVILTQLLKDETVDVVRRVGDWWEIVLPGSFLFIPEVRTGYILASQVVIDSVGPPSELAARARAASAPRPPTAVRQRRAILNIDGAYRLSSDDLTRSFTAFKGTLAEEGTIATNYGKSEGVAVGVMVGQAIWGPIGIGAGADYYLRKQSAAIEAHIPHPFYFNQLRPATFDTASLSRHEAAVHISAMWIPSVSSSIKILVYGGPTVFRDSQTVVTDLKLDERYPYDTVAITGVTTEERTGMVYGFHAGADVSYFFSRSVGVGGGARFSRATLKFDNDEEVATVGFAGAFHAVGGLRFRF